MAKEQARILIIDDDEDVLLTAKLVLKQHFTEVKTGNRPTELLDLLKWNEFDVVLLDMNFTTGAISGKEGLHWLKTTLKLSPQTHVILVTAYGDIELAVMAMKLGASDFVVKPWENDRLIKSVQTALKKKKVVSSAAISPPKNKPEPASTSQTTQKSPPDAVNMIGDSPAMQAVMKTIRKVAPTDVNVLILGENGTGKEVAARALHQLSRRADEVFVNVDLGAVAETLFEAELFGHVKGSFTDAREDRAGKFEAADRGTLFLDEIGNLSSPLQSKLLTVLQSRKVTRIGSNTPKQVDIRLICATNMPLYEMVKDSTFRQDLLYRINTVEIVLPPLRKRVEDIPELARYFQKIYAEKYQRNGMGLAPAALDKLCRYQWPGNIRELQHTLERAVIMSDNSLLQPEDFPLHTPDTLPDSPQAESAPPPSLNMEDIEKTTIIHAIEKHAGNLSMAAKELGMGRSTLYRRMAKYGL